MKCNTLKRAAHIFGVALLSVTLNESSQRPVIGSLHIPREKAGGKLFHPPVILYTLAADSLTTARLITAGAVL
jgi:hypothetical protein